MVGSDKTMQTCLFSSHIGCLELVQQSQCHIPHCGRKTIAELFQSENENPSSLRGSDLGRLLDDDDVPL